jgi:hypothetical protein
MKKQKTQSLEKCYQIKIRLLDAPLPIWRRLLIEAGTPLSVVHEIFQIAMDRL